MPGTDKSPQSAIAAEEVSHETPQKESSEAFQALMVKAFSGDTYKPTEAQVSKMIELQEKAMDYTHKERTQILPQYKFEKISNSLMLIFSTVIGLGVFIFVVLKSPEHTELVLGTLLGGLGGYGVGNVKPLTKKKNPNGETN